MRCWDEVVNDSYWLANGLAFRFLFYGVVSITTIQINLLTQVADLLNSMIRAALLIRRLHILENDMITHEALQSLTDQLRMRVHFEQQFLLYMVVHFVVLLAAMLMTLPSSVAINPLLPVIGGVCALIMTVVTWWVRSEFQTKRQTLFQHEKLQPECSSGPTLLPSANNLSSFG
jgi:hypothetical protein